MNIGEGLNDEMVMLLLTNGGISFFERVTTRLEI